MDPHISPVPSVPSIDPDHIQPGWATTEFWTTIATIAANLIGVAAIAFHLTPEQTSNLTATVTAILSALGVIAVNAVLAWKFVHSRTELKTDTIKANLAKEGMQQSINAASLPPGSLPAGFTIYPPGTAQICQYTPTPTGASSSSGQPGVLAGMPEAVSKPNDPPCH
jgi:hypothetical protein